MTLSLIRGALVLPVIWPHGALPGFDYFAKKFDIEEARRLLDCVETVRKFNVEQGGRFNMTILKEAGGYYAGEPANHDAATEPSRVSRPELLVNQDGVRWQALARVHMTTRLLTASELESWLQHQQHCGRRRAA